MLVIKSNDKKEPLVTDTGETITELIGKAVSPLLKPRHSLAKIVLPSGKSSTTHYHKITEETYFILAGEAWMSVNGEDFNLVPGDVCYLAPGDKHRINNMKNEDLVFLAICAPAWIPEDSFEI